jgi:hypothetical protein
MKLFKLILGVTAVAVMAAVLAPVANAQCATGAREFATVGGMNNQKLRVNTDGWHNSGQEIGRFWSANNSNDNNNFGGGCPSNDGTQTFGNWWQSNTGNANCAGSECYGVRGALAGTNCGGSTCQDDPLIVLVEDWGTAGPPGVGDTAHFFAARIDLDAAGAVAPRRWDFGLVDDSVNGQVIQGFVSGAEYPQAFVTSSNRAGSDVNTVQDYSDLGASVWAAVDTSTGLPDSSLVVSYDICTFTGAADPGRDRSMWNCSASVPYADGAVTGNGVTVSCPNTVDDTFVAIGATFDGGSGPDVPSALVGRATQVECNPNIANPEQRRPAIRRNSAERPSRSR